MEVNDSSGVKVYNVSAGKTIPEWLQEKKQGKSLRKDAEFRRRIELIQDFGFPASASRIKVAPNAQQIAAVGMYPPQIRMYDVNDLSMKFKRHVDAEIQEFQILSEDFSKLVFLRTDRTIEFHAKFGHYYKTRIPKFGRDIAYHFPSCDLYAVGVTNEIFRLNLEQGRFLKSLDSACPAINVCGINPAFGYLGVGGVNGVCELWDPRDRNRLGSLEIDRTFLTTVEGIVPNTSGITALRWSADGMNLALGTETGHVLIYDMRSNIPLRIKDHQFDVPIVDIKFNEKTRHVVSTCKKIVRVWNKDDGSNFFHIEVGANDITDTCIVPDSGLLFIATAAPKMNVYYVPDLGKAPAWASFLDNLTEELEEDNAQTQYQDYRFVTREELERLGVGRLIGTQYLRAYMHGFFMDYRLYQKIRAIAKPDEYKEYIKDRIRERMEAKRASRISVHRNTGLKVNKDVFSDKTVDKVVTDNRFSRLFSDPLMSVDKSSAAFLRMRPRKKREDDSDEDGEGVSDGNLGEIYEEVDDEAMDIEDQRAKMLADIEAGNMDDIGDSGDSDDSGDDDDREEKAPAKAEKPKAKAPKLYEAKNDATPFRSDAEAVERKRRMNTSLGKRVEEVSMLPARSRASTGNMVVSFIPDHLKQKDQEVKDAKRERRVKNKERRSMRDLMK